MSIPKHIVLVTPSDAKLRQGKPIVLKTIEFVHGKENYAALPLPERGSQ